MATRCSDLFTVFLVLICGHKTVLVQSQSAPAMAAAPLFNSGSPAGDVQITNVLDPTQVDLTFNISYFGFNYSKIFISLDGSVGFLKPVNYLQESHYSDGVRNSASDVPFLAPLLYKGYRPVNMDASLYQGKISYRTVDFDKIKTTDKLYTQHKQYSDYLGPYLRDSVINSPTSFRVRFLVVVTWNNVAEGTETKPCSPASQCKGATFQLVLAGDQSDTFAVFNYLKYDITAQATYEAGFNGGYSRGWYNVLSCHGGCFRYMDVAAVRDLKNFQGSDLKGRYIFSVGKQIIVRGGCLPKEAVSGILEIHPRSVGMFGGEKVLVSGLCGTTNAKIYCRFGSLAGDMSPVVAGAMVTVMKGYCPVPLLTAIGRVDVYWSNDNKTWTADQSINVALPSRLADPVKLEPRIKEAWYKKDIAEITVPWDPAKFTTQAGVKVDVKLIGYRENQTQVEYRELANFGSTENNRSSYTFQVEEHQCNRSCDEFELGLLEVSLPVASHGSALERVAVRFGPIPIGWYVNDEMYRHRGHSWSNQKCWEWLHTDSSYKDWLKDLLPCPCSLEQALADFGRWHTDPGCSMFAGSLCHFHQGAKHCVLSVVPTSKDGAGNQCCYGPDGSLMYSQLSDQGSTPDRSHVWGAHPYNRPNSVPELSHWRHDVISFYYCCLWNNYELCDRYMELRPTVSCHNYDVPGLGFVRGHTHLTTFDGFTYHFPGSGDFWLVEYARASLLIHGKFGERAQSWDIGELQGLSSWKPKALTALAMSSGRSKIEVSVAPEKSRLSGGLEIRIDGHLVYFLDKNFLWQEFEEFSVINNQAIINQSSFSLNQTQHNNFTFLLTKFSVGVNVVAVSGLLHVTVAAPPGFKPEPEQKANLLGLLGAYDMSQDNDFQPRRGDLVSLYEDKKVIFDKFVQSWKLDPTDYMIFKFDKPSEALDPQHSFFELSQISTNFKGAPNQTLVAQFCGSSENCKWDYQISGDQNVAKETKDADVQFWNLRNWASRVDNCGLPELGVRVILDSHNFSLDSEVTVTGCRHGAVFRGQASFRCENETQEEARKHGRGNYGVFRSDISNKESYVVHWVPRPYTVCSDVDSVNLPVIIGSVLGLVTVLIVAAVLSVVIFRRRKTGQLSCHCKKKVAAAAAAEGGGGGMKEEEGGAHTEAAETMLPSPEDKSNEPAEQYNEARSDPTEGPDEASKLEVQTKPWEYSL